MKCLKLWPSILLPHLLLRYVDDTFVILHAEHSHQLLQHINTQDPHIQFTTEDPSEDGALHFLDTLVFLGPNNTLTIVYEKPTHTDQYLQWDSNHFPLAKYSIYNTLAYRARVMCKNQPALQ